VYYLTGKADVGGFGVASNITAQGNAGLGCQITRNIYVEAGYRVLYYDYNSCGFSLKPRRKALRSQWVSRSRD